MRCFLIRPLVFSFLVLVFGTAGQAGWSQSTEGYATPVVAQVGDVVRLDPSDGFIDWVSQEVRVEWDWVSRPDLSVADLQDVTQLRAGFTPDVPGRYVARAQFFDVSDTSSIAPLHVVLVEASTGNSRPVARITARATPQDTYPLQLDGTRSFDIDGDALSYSWSVSGQGAGQSGSFSDATSPMPVLTVSAAGFYTVSLSVTDAQGETSPVAEMVVEAIAGWGGAVDKMHLASEASLRFEQLRAPELGEDIALDPYATTHVNGTYQSVQMVLATRPQGSVAKLEHIGDAAFSVAPDLDGDYLVSLRTADWKVGSATQLLISAGSAAPVRPVARIADVADAPLGQPLVLDGTQSYSFDTETQLSYDWSLLHRPAGSSAGLGATLAPQAEFVPDVPGLYVVQLRVAHEGGASVPATLALQVETPFPVARAGLDAVVDMTGSASLDGSGSLGADLDYAWSAIGLSYGSGLSGFTGADTAQPVITLPQVSKPFRDIIHSSPVYHIKRADKGGLCTFDTRLPDDIAGANPDQSLQITLHARGRLAWNWWHQVWEIENKRDFTRVIELRSASGQSFGSWVVPGRTSVHVHTPDIGNVQMRAMVDGTIAASRRATGNNTFSRNNPVCSGYSSSVMQLIVSNAAGISYPDTVYAGGLATRPVLLRPAAVAATAGQEVTLAAGSLVLRGAPEDLSYRWSLIYGPGQSQAGIAERDVADLSFTPDRAGLYLIQLEASDGLWVAQPVVLAIEVPNTPPVAVVSDSASVFVGETATLDGSGSFDPDGDVLFYNWSLTSAPDGSTAQPLAPDAPITGFVPDRRGSYVFSLTVSDGQASSTPASVTLTVPNRAPLAALSGPAELAAGTEGLFSASGSSDPDGDTLSYSFAILTAPAGAQTQLAPEGDDAVRFSSMTPGDYVLEVTVSDGLAEASAQTSVTVGSVNRPPVLSALDSPIVIEAGLQLSLDLEASDPDGDVLRFFARPLPLPQGMHLDANTGALRWRPELGQEGSYTLTVGVTDGLLSDRQEITIEVVSPSGPDTVISGVVRDAVTGLPLADMPVRLRSADVTTVTDAAGQFTFTALGAGEDIVLVEPFVAGGPGGYMSKSRGVRITASQNRDISPDILLSPLNDGCAEVVAGEATVLSQPGTGLSVTIPADSVQSSSGGAYSGEICIGSLPQLFAQPGLPEGTQACQVYSVFAPEAIFTQPITISAPNFDALPVATQLALWQMAPERVNFRSAASAVVDAGGDTVSASLSGLRDGALFTFLPQAPQTQASSDQPEGGRSLTVLDGNYTHRYTLPGYRAFNQMQTVSLVYNSRMADATTIVAGDVTIRETASLPVSLTTRLAIRGLSLEGAEEWTPRLRGDGYEPALLGEAVTLRQSMPVDLREIADGRYRYDFIAQANYACSTVSGRHGADLFVNNASESPYGNGWTIGGLQRLHVDDQGRVTINEDGTTTTFNPEPTLTQFEDEPLVFPTIGTQGEGLSVGDFFGDGRLHIAYGESGTGSINFIRNFGNRQLEVEQPDRVTVAAPNTVPQTGTYTPNLTSIAAGNLFNVGNTDIVYSTQLDQTIGTLANDGFGRFTNQVERQNQRTPQVLVSNLDGDEFDDVIGASVSGSSAEIWVGWGSATGRSYQRISTRCCGAPLQILSKDITGNGLLDLVYRTNNRIVFLYQDSSRVFSRQEFNAPAGASPNLGFFMAMADLNGNGFGDLVWGGANTLQVFLNGGTSGTTFFSPIALQLPPGITQPNVFIGDANGNGISDIIVSGGQTVAVYLNNGDGSFQPFEEGFVNYNSTQVAFADIDGDGSLDLISATRFAVRVHFSRPSASGRFVSGSGEFSELTRLADGSYERRYRDGRVIVYDATGLQTAEVDPDGNRREYAYGDRGELVSITDQVGGVTQFFYEESPVFRLSLIVYPDGRETAFTYDDTGNLAAIEEPEGSQVSFSYDASGRLVSTVNQNGNTGTIRYDGAGALAGGTMPDGSQVTLRAASTVGLVDQFGNGVPNPRIYVRPEDRITTMTDQRGEVSEVEVNEYGSIIRMVDPLGRATLIERDSDNLMTRLERPSATGGVQVDTFTYDLLGNMTGHIEAVGTPEERSFAFAYEPEFSRVISETDPDGFTTSYVYDATGKVIGITDPLGATRSFSYRADGLMASRTDENGNTTSFAYNAQGNLSQITYADGSITEMTYDTRGNETAITEALGTPEQRSIERAFDQMNRVFAMRVVDASGTQLDDPVFYSYLPGGQLETVTDETGLVTTMSYDALERLISVDDPAQGLIQRVYSDAGDVIQHINGNGQTHLYGYDEVGRLAQTTDPEGFTKTFAYDARDNVTSVTDGRSGTTSFSYDPLDRVIARTNPLGLTIAHAYDARGNLITRTREDGTLQQAVYDARARMTSITTDGDLEEFAFDPRGNLIEAINDASRVTFTYDPRHRVASVSTDGAFGPQPSITLSYSYDARGRRVSMSDSLGGTTSYVWDAKSRLSEMTAPWATVYSFGYDGAGRRTGLTRSSGLTSTMTYDNGLMSALSHVQSGVTLTDLTYGYTVDGQLAAILDNLDPARSRFISYDQLNRLVQVSEGVPPAQGGLPVPVEDYAWDEEGNRTASHLSGLYAANAHNQLLEDDDFTYANDARGNRISRTAKATGAVTSYLYDSRNRLIGVEGPEGVSSYLYDALGRRIAVTPAGGVQTVFVYDTWNPRSAITDEVALEFAGGALVKRWLHGPRVDEPLGFERYTATTAPGTGTAHEVIADRLGSVLGVVDVATGQVAGDYRYDAFGARTVTGEAIRYGFTGREHDASGLIYFRARHFDPQTGRFLQADPIGFAAGDLNIYAYVWNDPFNWTDPSGLSASLEWANLQRATAASLGVAGIFAAIIDLAQNINDALNLPSIVFNNPEGGSESGDRPAPPPPPGGGDDNCQPGGGNGNNGPPKNEWAKIILTALGLFAAEPGPSGPEYNPTDVRSEIRQRDRRMEEWDRDPDPTEPGSDHPNRRDVNENDNDGRC